MFDQIGIGALHNMTDIPFLTSDNPVIWFDPSVPQSEMQPYVLQVNGPVVLLFPVAPNLMIYGHSSMREGFAYDRFRTGELSDRSLVKDMNRQTCRFAYNFVFAQRGGQEALIRKHAGVSPVLRTADYPHWKREHTRLSECFRKAKAQTEVVGVPPTDQTTEACRTASTGREVPHACAHPADTASSQPHHRVLAVSSPPGGGLTRTSHRGDEKSRLS